MLTDGSTNFDQLKALISANTIKNKLHTIGVGDSISGKDKVYLIESAESGKGISIFISEKENFSDKIIKLLEQTLSPCLSNINL